MPAAGSIASNILLYYGRLALQNAYGSELLDLPMPFLAQYYNGSSWLTNTYDQCTASITMTESVVTGPITTSQLCAYDASSLGSGTGSVCTVAGSSANLFSQPPVTGNFNLNFKAPGSGNTGAMLITAAVPNYLTFNWQGTGNTNPTAVATFGIYKGFSNYIYIRELY